MERSQRITRINAMHSRPGGSSMTQLIDDLQVSRATLNRDLELMCDQMNAPIAWDRDRGIYRVEPTGQAGPTYMLPGLWLRPAPTRTSTIRWAAG